MNPELIALDCKFLLQVESKQKTTTIRAGHRDYKVGPGKFYFELYPKTLDFYILNVEYKTFGELTDADALTDGFSDLEELKTELLKFYPHLQDTDEVTKVVFSLQD